MCIVRFATTVTMYVFTARNVTHIIKKTALRERVNNLVRGERRGGRGVHDDDGDVQPLYGAGGG